MALGATPAPSRPTLCPARVPRAPCKQGRTSNLNQQKQFSLRVLFRVGDALNHFMYETRRTRRVGRVAYRRCSFESVRNPACQEPQLGLELGVKGSIVGCTPNPGSDMKKLSANAGGAGDAKMAAQVVMFKDGGALLNVTNLDP